MRLPARLHRGRGRQSGDRRPCGTPRTRCQGYATAPAPRPRRTPCLCSDTGLAQNTALRTRACFCRARYSCTLRRPGTRDRSVYMVCASCSTYPCSLIAPSIPGYYLKLRPPVRSGHDKVLALATCIAFAPSWHLPFGGHGDEDEDGEARGGGGGPGQEVSRWCSGGVHEGAADNVGEDLPDAELEEPYGEHAAEEGVGHTLLQDGVGGDVLGAVGDPGHDEGAEREDEGG